MLIDGKPEAFPIRSKLQANNGEVLLQAAAAGLGIACEPVFNAREQLASGAVVEILKEFPLPELGIYAVLPGNRLVPHRLRVLIEFLAGRLKAQGFGTAHEEYQDP